MSSTVRVKVGGFLFARDETLATVLSGLTVTNGYSIYGGGAWGIYCYRASPLLLRCWITASNGRQYGGGLLQR